MRAHTLVNQDAEPPPGDFYVTVRDGSRVGYLSGPYGDIRTALANVDSDSTRACAGNTRAHFYAYGVARVPITHGPVRTVFSTSHE